MMPVQFQAPEWLLLLGMLPLMAALWMRAARRRSGILRTFAGESHILHAAQRRHRRRGWAACLGAGFLVLALARPAWRQEIVAIESSGRDLVFVLDASRSMLADDIFPNRLESAKTAINDALDSFAGDRVALVVFAGSAEIQCPLTEDYEFFRMTLNQVASTTPAVGGTQIAGALAKVAEKVLQPGDSGYADVFLISDGEDQAGKGEEAVDELNKAGARLIAIGIGDKEKGSHISLPSSPGSAPRLVTHAGKPVITRLRPENMEKLARKSLGGLSYEVGRGPFNLKWICRDAFSQAPKQVRKSPALTRTSDASAFFLGAALLILWLGWLNESSGPLKPLAFKKSAAFALLLSLAGGSLLRAEENAGEWFAHGNRLYQAGNYAAAQKAFANAGAKRPDAPEISYNEGAAAYRNGDYSAAVEDFQIAAEKASAPSLRADGFYNLGNSLFREAESAASKDPKTALGLYQEAIQSYRSALETAPSFPNAAYNLELALSSAERVRKKLRETPREDSQGESGAPEEESDQDGEESQSDEDDENSQNSSSAAKDQETQGKLAGYNETRGVPLPNLSFEDILTEERRNDEQRTRENKQYQNVEEDW